MWTTTSFFCCAFCLFCGARRRRCQALTPQAEVLGSACGRGAHLHRVAHINARSAQWEVLLDGRSHGEFPSEVDPSRAHLPRCAPRLTEGSVCRRHPQEGFAPILFTMRRSDATREPLWRPRSARDTDSKGARWRLEALTKGASAPLVHTLAARRKLVHADSHTTASSTRDLDTMTVARASRLVAIGRSEVKVNLASQDGSCEGRSAGRSDPARRGGSIGSSESGRAVWGADSGVRPRCRSWGARPRLESEFCCLCLSVRPDPTRPDPHRPENS